MHCEGGLVLALTLGLWSGCRGDTRAPAADGWLGTRATSTTVRGPVVARVDGDPIGLAEVQQLCSASGLPADQALERLIGERLLVRHAIRQGYGELPVVERAGAQARVRALLALTVEASRSPTTLHASAAEPRAATVAEQKEQLERLLAQLALNSRVAYDEAAIHQAFKRDLP